MEDVKLVRIQSKPGDVTGHAVTITDLNTGKIILGIFAVDVHLSATDRNVAKISYYETDANGNIVIGTDEEPIERTVEIENPEIDVTAIEDRS